MGRRLVKRLGRHPIWPGLLLIGVAAGLGCTKGSPTISAIAIDPKKPEIMYVGTMRHIHKSRDGGETWEIADTGMTSARIMSLAVDPRVRAQVFAGTFGDATYKSWNGGQSWIPDNRGLKEHISIVTVIIFDSQLPTHMYLGSTVGVFKRTDPDGFWRERVEGMASVYVTALVEKPDEPGTLYAGTTGGVYQSTNRAEHWTAINEGLDIDEVGGALSYGVDSIAIDRHNTHVLFIAGKRGLYQSTNGGQLWKRIEAFPERNVSAVVIDHENPDVLYVAQDGMSKSTDGGATWVAINTGLTSQGVRVLAMDPKDPSTLFAGTNRGLFKTTNGGETWVLKQMNE